MGLPGSPLRLAECTVCPWVSFRGRPSPTDPEPSTRSLSPNPLPSNILCLTDGECPSRCLSQKPSGGSTGLGTGRWALEPGCLSSSPSLAISCGVSHVNFSKPQFPHQQNGGDNCILLIWVMRWLKRWILTSTWVLWWLKRWFLIQQKHFMWSTQHSAQPIESY